MELSHTQGRQGGSPRLPNPHPPAGARKVLLLLLVPQCAVAHHEPSPGRRHHHRSFLEHAMFQPSEQSSLSLLPTVSVAAGVTSCTQTPHSGLTQLHLCPFLRSHGPEALLPLFSRG